MVAFYMSNHIINIFSLLFCGCVKSPIFMVVGDFFKLRQDYKSYLYCFFDSNRHGTKQILLSGQLGVHNLV